MIQFSKHNRYLKSLIQSSTEIWDVYNTENAVNLDTIDAVLRNYLSKEEIHAEGSFFTGQKLATATVNSFKKPLTFASVVLDPTCGTGNLLIECSRKLGIEEKLSDTLKIWGKILRGYDIHKAFVEASKLRLVIEAIRRGCILDCDFKEALSYLKHIKLNNAMEVSPTNLKHITHLIMNPPFTLWPSPASGIWKKGKVNAAGLVFEHYVNSIPENCSISAILPDVLRSGSRYLNLRIDLSRKVSGMCEVWGRFNKQADVDVFILSGHKSTNNSGVIWHEEVFAEITIADKFDVCIGPLVHYRDPEVGTKYPYIHAKNVTRGTEVSELSESRCFSGKVIVPPFVVVKRTSSPSDTYRAAAAVINIQAEAVAVENHLIVLKPKSGTLKDCRKLVKILGSESVNQFLNQRIRLRHLTVEAIKAIPLG